VPVEFHLLFTEILELEAILEEDSGGSTFIGTNIVERVVTRRI
jgi:hypothetical protein